MHTSTHTRNRKIRNKDFSGCTVDQAWGLSRIIDQWTRDVVQHRRLPELKKFARTIREHKELILNYFRAKKEYSSGIVEGFKNKAKLTVRKSYGFRSDELREIALYHRLENLPVPEFTHRFVGRGRLFIRFQTPNKHLTLYILKELTIFFKVDESFFN